MTTVQKGWALVWMLVEAWGNRTAREFRPVLVRLHRDFQALWGKPPSALPIRPHPTHPQKTPAHHHPTHHTEKKGGFATPAKAKDQVNTSPSPPIPTTMIPIRLRRGTRTITFEVAPGESVLEAAIAAGISLPHSCTMGGCGACRLRAQGAFFLKEPNCLSESERREGYVLTCRAYPLSPGLIEWPEKEARSRLNRAQKG
ncbi:MAG: 2Fe-2S iron-sulfur cluster binding domain-containing protein [Sandaracinaceae bacterium]|nr:2Fe-2S iron-sulfur cluster binding domain-containing protein [Sandaracinaceae bacterium]